MSALYDQDVKVGHKIRYYAVQVVNNDNKDIAIGRFKSATNGIKVRHCDGMTVFVDNNDVTKEGISIRWFAPYSYKGPVNIL